MWKLKIAEGKDQWLKSENNYIGRQTWEFDPDLGTPEERAAVDHARQQYSKNRFRIKHTSDLLMRMQFARENPHVAKLPPVNIEEGEDITEEAVTRTLRRAIDFYSTIQAHDGHWPNDYGGASFLLPGLVIGLHIVGALNTVLSAEHQREIRRYIYNHQNADGGWGLHTEGHSIMFCTALFYVALRLLGEDADGGEEGEMLKARKWVLDRGGATAIPSWGKMWLSILGVYEWAGNNPMPPELWLLPYYLPIHPGRMWCHCRMVYLPMSYLYGKRFVGPITGLISSLRAELYTIPYEQIDWNKARYSCAKEDLYYPHPLIQDILWECLYKLGEPLLTRWPFCKLRTKALSVAMQHIHYEDENTSYICIGAVNKVLNMVCCWVEDPNSEAFKSHLPRIHDYLWVAEDGMKMQGTDGSQLWDTAFAIQAIVSSNLIKDYSLTLQKGHDFIKRSQIQANRSGDFSSHYRHLTKGAWPFSTPDQGWQVSDTTAEGLKTAILLSKLPTEVVGKPLPPEKLYDAVNVILSLQNKDGSFASYELTRSHEWMELINPCEVFEDIVIDHPHVECSSSVIQALASFTKLYPGYRRKEIYSCISRVANYIESIQETDGSWYGNWGVCYIYATWFAVLGLVAAGKTYSTNNSIQKACNFLLLKQQPSGGWGESYLSCQNKVYTNLKGNKSHLVNTAWAMLALMATGQVKRDSTPLHRAARFLINMQMKNGDFPQQEIIGVFNRNCMINYSGFKNIFPIWALAEYRRQVL